MNRFEAERYVDRVIVDADYDRKRGGEQTNEQVLREKLIDALTDPGTALLAAAKRASLT